MKDFSSAGQLVSGLIIISLLMGSANADPVVVNPSFEQVQIGSNVSSNPADVPGWTHAGSGGDGLLWGVGLTDGPGTITTAGDGNQFVTLGGGFDAPGSASWSQTVGGFVVGNSYNLGFKMAAGLSQSYYPAEGDQTITASVPAGSSTAAQTFTVPQSPIVQFWHDWESKTYSFTATATSATIEFSVSNQQFDIGLDSVSITDAGTVAPLPSSASMGCLLLLGAALVGRCRSSRKWGKSVSF